MASGSEAGGVGSCVQFEDFKSQYESLMKDRAALQAAGKRQGMIREKMLEISRLITKVVTQEDIKIYMAKEKFSPVKMSILYYNLYRQSKKVGDLFFALRYSGQLLGTNKPVAEEILTNLGFDAKAIQKMHDQERVNLQVEESAYSLSYYGLTISASPEEVSAGSEGVCQVRIAGEVPILSAYLAKLTEYLKLVEQVQVHIERECSDLDASYAEMREQLLVFAKSAADAASSDDSDSEDETDHSARVASHAPYSTATTVALVGGGIQQFAGKKRPRSPQGIASATPDS